MRKEFCDRCGSELQMSGIHRFILHPYKLTFYGVSHGSWVRDRSEVLCSECKVEFDKWFRGKAVKR